MYLQEPFFFVLTVLLWTWMVVNWFSKKTKKDKKNFIFKIFFPIQQLERKFTFFFFCFSVSLNCIVHNFFFFLHLICTFFPLIFLKLFKYLEYKMYCGMVFQMKKKKTDCKWEATNKHWSIAAVLSTSHTTDRCIWL